MKAGTRLAVPGLPGVWSVWSKVAEAPGAHAVVPYDDAARGTKAKHAIVRVQMPRNAAVPTVTLIRTER